MESKSASKQEETDTFLNYIASSNYYESSFSTPSQPSVRCPTLTSFLNHLNLSQYHGLFINAGVGENNIEQLLNFDEVNLKEVISAISMKPFHSVVFKKGIKELRQNFSFDTTMLLYSNNQSVSPFSPFEFQTMHKLIKERIPMYVERLDNFDVSESSYVQDQDAFMKHEKTLQDSANPAELTNTASTESSVTGSIIYHATIYGKKSTRPLNSYEQAINNAAIKLALQDPVLVSNKGSLFEKAKEKLFFEGYNYKRGTSRSKLAKKIKKSESRALLAASRASHNSKNRNARIAELERKLKVKMTQYELLEGIKSTQNPEALEKAQISLDELTKEKIEISNEIEILKIKERKHQLYEQEKKEKIDPRFDENVKESLNN